MVPGPPSTALVPRMRNFQIPPLTLYVQSKKCQTLHWKAAHKAVCARYAAQLGQNLGGDRDKDEGEQERALNRWIEAWASVIITCLSIALDLANHQWDRHDTHLYVHLPATITEHC